MEFALGYVIKSVKNSKFEINDAFFLYLILTKMSKNNILFENL